MYDYHKQEFQHIALFEETDQIPEWRLNPLYSIESDEFTHDYSSFL